MTPWTVARQAPPSIAFSRKQHWSGLPCLSSVDLLDPGIEPQSPVLQADSLPSEPPGKSFLKPGKNISKPWLMENPMCVSPSVVFDSLRPHGL